MSQSVAAATIDFSRGPKSWPQPHAAWKSFRESDDSRYVALTMPRVLSRLPYGKDFKKVDEFNYEANVDGTDHSKYSRMTDFLNSAVGLMRLSATCRRLPGSADPPKP